MALANVTKNNRSKLIDQAKTNKGLISLITIIDSRIIIINLFLYIWMKCNQIPVELQWRFFVSLLVELFLLEAK